MEESTIKFNDLLLHILRRWRLILLLMLICAFVLNGYKVYKVKKEADRIQNLISEYEKKLQETAKLDSEEEDKEKLFEESVLSLDEYEENLTERQIAEVQSMVSMYKMYQRPYTEIVDYINNSIRMQLDPNAVPSMVLQYLIDIHYSVEYPEIEKRDYTNDIRNSIYQKLFREDVLGKMADAIGENVSPAYMRELVGTSTPGDDIYAISIIARSEEECRSLIEIVKNEMPAVMEQQKRIYGDFDYQLISENYYVTYNQDILNAQKNQADTMRALRSTTSDIIEKLSAEQKTYFYALINNDETITIQLPVEKDSSNQLEELIDPSTLVVPIVNWVYPKQVLFGFMIGAFLSCLYLLCKVLLNGKLLSVENLENSYGMPALGTLRVSPESKGVFSGFDKWLIKTLDGRGSQFSPEESLAMVTAGIRLAAAKNGWSRLYVTSTAKDEGTSRVIAMICDRLKGQVEQMDYGRSIVYDPESLDAMTRADAIVIVERTDVSRYDEIHREYNLCQQHKVPVLGYVALK